MKYIKILLLTLFFMPGVVRAADEFTVAAQLLAAAKNADIQQVQLLINNGADINYVDSTGLSVVCTALMNNDLRAAQILQMYGADASKCDRQIKQFNNKTKKTTSSGGLFSGLSSAQSIALAAAGAAVVVGGLFLLTDVFDPGNDNDVINNGGDRPNGGGGETPDGATGETAIPVGPAYFNANGQIAYSTAAYNANLNLWNPSAGGIRQWDYNYFRPDVQPNNNFKTDGIIPSMQNYLLTMHGYSSFANGYFGQSTIRDEAHNPVKLANETGGGRPVAVAMITANGINPTGSLSRTDSDGKGVGIAWADSASATSNTYTVDKFFNFTAPTIVDGNLVLGGEMGGFDFSGSGTVMNPFATANETALGKIIGGWEAGGRATGDLFGFVPNGQLAVYRTGGGNAFVDIVNPTDGPVLGTVTKAAADAPTNQIQIGDSITIDGKTYKISSAVADSSITAPTITVGGVTFKLPNNSQMLRAKCESANAADCENVSDIAIYRGTDGFYYINSTGGNRPDAVYVVDQNNIYAQKEYKPADIKNYEAMYNARGTNIAVLANVSLNPASRAVDYLTMRDLPALFNLGGASVDKKGIFGAQIDKYYDKDTADVTTQGGYANSMFNNYGEAQPIIVNAAGEFEFGQGAGKSLAVMDATFENYAPALYDSNLEHLFMTIVAVQHAKGTDDANTIGDYGNGTGSNYGPLYLSMWTDNRGTDDKSDDIIYSSRKCGVAGLGINGIDPWCFSAAGPTTEMAAASAAGAVAAIKGAFPYMKNKQIFSLLALTADGYLLGTDANGAAFTKENLVAYLKTMYSLPPEYNAAQLSTNDYLKAFAEVYGYGMINLERAMTPGKKLYYYDGGKIVSAAGNAYWRAATNTVFRASGAFNPRAASISAPFFDIIESVDGTMQLPRVWKNEFAIGPTNARGLYMGDVLGEMRVRDDDARTRHLDMGDMRFSMSASDKAYADNLGGLDTMELAFDAGNLRFGAGYQRNFTDGAARFDGMNNPVFGLASNVMTTDVEFSHGRWALRARGFTGAVTDESLLQNDPTVSAQYAPARLGLVHGGVAGMGWRGDKFTIAADLGTANETDTVLGAQTGGLLSLGGGETDYVDVTAAYHLADNVTLRARSTFARTRANAAGEFILGVSDIESNALALGIDAGGFSFTVSRPLGVTRGMLQYAHAEYDVVENADGKYDLVIGDTYVADMDLRPAHREIRFSGSYRHSFGDYTDGALGFIYRKNPNHTADFGDEAIFMLKFSHRLGI